MEELAGALPQRDTVDGIVDYLNNPTSYDGLKDISEVHPSIRSADLFPKMRSMKQQDLYDISAYILYQNFTRAHADLRRRFVGSVCALSPGAGCTGLGFFV